MRDLDQVLADALGEAAVLRRRGFTQYADGIEELIGDVRKSAEEFLTFVPESQALLRGAKLAFLRRNFPGWEKEGNARRVGRGREYRAIILPRMTPASIAREAGRRGERPDGQRRVG